MIRQFDRLWYGNSTDFGTEIRRITVRNSTDYGTKFDGLWYEIRRITVRNSTDYGTEIIRRTMVMRKS
jgi:hypothetical protein